MYSKQVQESGWVHSQQSPPPIEEMGGLVEAEDVCEIVQSHCSYNEASPDALTHPPQVSFDLKLICCIMKPHIAVRQLIASSSIRTIMKLLKRIMNHV